jgi:hypothetical protein
MRACRRDMRDKEVAAGIRAPRTQRETRIWQNSLHVLKERRQGRAAGVPEDELPPLPYELPPGRLLPQAEPLAEPSRWELLRERDTERGSDVEQGPRGLRRRPGERRAGRSTG